MSDEKRRPEEEREGTGPGGGEGAPPEDREDAVEGENRSGKDEAGEGNEGGGPEEELRRKKERKPGREDAQPRDDELYTPQGGGGGTGSGPLDDVAVVRGAPRSGPKEDLREDVMRPGMTLHQVADRAVDEEEVEPPEGSPPEDALPEEDEVSSFRLLMTLAVAGAIAGAVLVFVYLWSQPKILAFEAMVLDEAIQEVLKSPDHYQTVFLLSDSTLTERLPEGVDSLDENQVLDKVYLGYDDAGNPVGYALQGEGFGFQDIITLIFGYDARDEEVLGMKVLSHLETPGLGDKIVKDTAFVSEFDGVAAPIDGVKPDRNTGQPDQVDMITGATISSEAVIDIINARIGRLGALLSAYEPTGAAPADVSPGTESGEPGEPGEPGETREDVGVNPATAGTKEEGP